MRRFALIAAALLLTSGCGAAGAAGSSGGGAGPQDPPADCPTRSMLDDYPGEYPNAPRDPRPLADACIAHAHDVILVLGCPNDPDGAPSACQEKRADLAVALSKAGFGERFITSGAAVHNVYVEADTLRDLLIQRGVPEANIFTEPLAQHTDENLYYATKIMEAQAWKSAIVVSDDPGHLVQTAVCDSNCCVELGRLTVVELGTASGDVVAGHYARYPWAAKVSAEECAQIEQPSKFMCVNLPDRKACAAGFRL